MYKLYVLIFFIILAASSANYVQKIEHIFEKRGASWLESIIRMIVDRGSDQGDDYLRRRQNI